MSETELRDVRDYWDRRPCNLFHSPAQVGTRKYFDQVEQRKYFVEPHIPSFAQFDRWRGKRVLEIGCGLGTDTVNFARAGANIDAVDLSANSLRLAKQRAELFGLNVNFRYANAENLTQHVPGALLAPFRKFDLIYSFGVIHHTPHPDRALRQITAFMNKDSELRLMVYHKRSWKVAGILLRALARGDWRSPSRLIADESEAQTGCPVTYSYTRKEAGRLLEENGLTVVDMFVEHIFPYRVADYVEYRYVKAWPFAWMSHRLFRGLERRFGWHLCIVAKLRSGNETGNDR